MTQWHEKGRRKPSGGMRTASRRRDKLLSTKGGGGEELLSHQNLCDDRPAERDGRGRRDEVRGDVDGLQIYRGKAGHL